MITYAALMRLPERMPIRLADETLGHVTERSATAVHVRVADEPQPRRLALTDVTLVRGMLFEHPR